MGRVPLRLGDALAIHRCHNLALFLKAVVAINAEQDKGWEDQQEQQKLHDPGVLADKIKHVDPLAKSTKKANQVRLQWVVGADGLEPPTYAL